MLNVLSHGDEEGMGQFIPFRKGHTGLHLPDALGLAVAALPRPEVLGLARSYGAKLGAADTAAAKQLAPDQITKAEAKVRAGIEATFKYFKTGKDDITKFLNDGGTIERYLVPINDPAREAVAARVLAPMFKGVGKAAEPAAGDKKGLFSRLFGKG
jgi:hypothetical protein